MRSWWKSVFLAGLFVPALATADVPPAAAPPAAMPFAPGEELSYELALLGIRAGEAMLRVEEDPLAPGTFKLLAFGRSLGAADSLFRLRQTASCVVNKDSLALQICRIATQQRSGDRRREFVVDRDRKVVRERTLQDGKPRERVVDFGDGIDRVQEALSGLYFLRSRLPAEGESLRFPAVRKGKSITVEASRAGTSSIVTPAGKFEAVEVRLAVVKGEADEGETAGSLWFSTDAQRLPVKLSFDAKVGKLEAILATSKGTRDTVPSSMPPTRPTAEPSR